ncbi:MAG: hypothetical protein NC321_02955 [Clostridium sp.]|nr:hypothetical protein [Clostridium sp.]
MSERKKSFGILIVLLAFFLGMFAMYGVGVYNDSEQYITMHIHREPLYPLFLAFFRMIGKESGGLVLAAAAQNLLTAFSIFFLIEYLRKKFSLNRIEEIVLLILELMPHLVTRYVSALGIFMENSVMSEALCIPLFQLFILFTLRMMFEDRKRDMVYSLIFAWLLSMTRGQMMAAILLWMVAAAVKMIVRKQYRKLMIPVLAVICAFGLRTLSVHVYNYGVTGYFMGNTYGQLNTLTNVIYACDKEDGEVFREGSLERAFFDKFYEEADALSLNYKYAGKTWNERAAHLEESHDMLKFQILEADMTAYYFKLGKVDYYMQSSMSDDMAGRMLRKLLPVCFGQWFYDYLLLCRNGFIRSIAVVHKWINPLAFMIYLAAFVLFIAVFYKNRKSPAVYVMGLALLFIAANVCATSLTIMCLSRYMIYGFSLFYMALFLLAVEWRRVLLQHFKQTQSQVRPAVEKMLEEARRVATSESGYVSYEDVFGEEKKE